MVEKRRLHKGHLESTLAHSIIQTKQKKWSQLSRHPLLTRLSFEEASDKQIPQTSEFVTVEEFTLSLVRGSGGGELE